MVLSPLIVLTVVKCVAMWSEPLNSLLQDGMTEPF